MKTRIFTIDNGFCERSFKNLCVGRRNWLFCNTPDGAEATVIVYSLIETAKANGANPYYYLKYLLEEMPKHMEEVDIPAVGNHQSDAMETSCPEYGNHLDWVIVLRSEMTVLSSPQPHCGAKQALQYRNF